MDSVAKCLENKWPKYWKNTDNIVAKLQLELLRFETYLNICIERLKCFEIYHQWWLRLDEEDISIDDGAGGGDGCAWGATIWWECSMLWGINLCSSLSEWFKFSWLPIEESFETQLFTRYLCGGNGMSWEGSGVGEGL